MWLAGSRPLVDVYVGRYAWFFSAAGRWRVRTFDSIEAQFAWLLASESASKPRFRFWLSSWWARGVLLPKGIDPRSTDELTGWAAQLAVANFGYPFGGTSQSKPFVQVDGEVAAISDNRLVTSLLDIGGRSVVQIAPWWQLAINSFVRPGTAAVAISEPDASLFVMESEGGYDLVDWLDGHGASDSAVHRAWERALMTAPDSMGERSEMLVLSMPLDGQELAADDSVGCFSSVVVRK